MARVSSTQYENATCAYLNETNQAYNPNGCSSNFDSSICWKRANYGQTVERVCPFKFCTSMPECAKAATTLMVTRTCHTDGSWLNTNYNQCVSYINDTANLHCIQAFCNTCPEFWRDLVVNVSLTLSIISVTLLVAALILFSIFDSIQCRRLSIHKNLAMAFVLRFALFDIWTVSNSSLVFWNCQLFKPLPIREYEWICKGILWLVIYFQVSSVLWMLIEGAYLYSRFTVFAMRQHDAPWSVYLACGWGIPFIAVLSWAIIHELHSRQNSNSFCWIPYAQGNHLWILAATMGIALVLNLIFLLGIVVILAQKLRHENAAESKKIWRTIKATLLLVPLLGISNIPLFYEPQKPHAVYMLGSAILQHSQGIFIAVLYCFLNSEIQQAVKRQLSKVPIEFFKPRQRCETERTYVPETRTTHTKHGVPMEELNGTKKNGPHNNGALIYSNSGQSEIPYSNSRQPIISVDSSINHKKQEF